jgi:hypothetical protein
MHATQHAGTERGAHHRIAEADTGLSCIQTLGAAKHLDQNLVTEDLQNLSGQDPPIGCINPHQLAEPGRKHLFQKKQRTANGTDRIISMFREAHRQPP